MFGGLYFGQYWTEEAAAAAAAFLHDPGGPERVRKQEEPDIWPQPWMAPHVPPPQPEPDFTGTTAPPTFTAPEPESEPFIATPDQIAALSSSLSPDIQIDTRLASEIAALKASLRRELEEEEILFLMGFFD